MYTGAKNTSFEYSMLLASNFALTLGVVLLLALAAHAQNRTLGEIRGTVVDKSDARVADVQVSIVDVLTGVETRAKTNEHGVYDSPSLVPGTYRITFRKEGFKSFVADDLLLRAELVTVNGTLNVGTATEQIEVSALSTEIQTESAEVRSDLGTKVVDQLPNVGRSEFGFEELVPGIQPDGAAYVNSPNEQSTNGNNYVALGGKQAGQVLWTLDGAMRTLPGIQHVWLSTPPLDAVETVSYLTNNFGAQYGNGMSVFNATTKSGTNNWHGSAYEFFQQNFMNAAAPPNPVTPFRWNLFGGSVGGPIIKKKAFFFFSFERNPTKTFAQGAFSFPTQAMRNGDFSQYPLPDGSGVQTVYDPSTGGATRSPFPGNKLPQIDPIAAAIQKYFPLPNYASPAMQKLGQSPQVCNAATVPLPPVCFVNNYWFTNGVTVNNVTQEDAKIDYNFSDKHRLDGSVLISKELYPFGFNAGAPLNGQLQQNLWQYTGQVSDFRTFSPSLVNEFRFAFNRFYGDFFPLDFKKDLMHQVGLANDIAPLFPGISVSGGVFGLGFNSSWPEFASRHVEESFVPSDIVTWIKGKHVLTLGGEFDRFHDDGFWTNPEIFIFSGIATQDLSGIQANPNNQAPYQGVPYADFLLGDLGVWGSQGGAIPISTGARQWNTQLFAQDDFKVTKNLTLNIGMRWEMVSGWTEVEGRVSNFSPMLVNPNPFQADTGNPLPAGTLGAIAYGNGVVPPTQHNLFAPRLGFAWSPRSNWAIRGGYGIYYAMKAGNSSGFNGNYGTGWVPQGFASSPNPTNSVPAFNWSTGAPGGTPGVPGYVTPSAATRTPDALNAQSVTYVPPLQPLGYAEQWQVGVQHQIRGGFLIDVAYVGDRGVHLPFTKDINQVPGNKLQNPNLVDMQQFRPYPQYFDISAVTNDGISMYNALQVTIKRQFRTGLTLITNYSQSKEHDAGSASADHPGVDTYQDAYHIKANYTVSSYDVPYVVNGAVVYELPFGKGKNFLKWSGIGDYLVGGWQLSSLFSLTGGIPFSPTLAAIGNQSGSASGGAVWYPNEIASPWVAGPVMANIDESCHAVVGQTLPDGTPGRAPAKIRTTAAWFNPCAFEHAAPGTFGQDTRNSLRAPAYRSADFSLAKSFRVPQLGEGATFQLRWDVQDAFNHHVLGIPSGIVDLAGSSGVISSTSTARTMQIGGKISF